MQSSLRGYRRVELRGTCATTLTKSLASIARWQADALEPLPSGTP